MHVCVMRWLRVVGRLLRDQRSVLMIINVFFFAAVVFVCAY